MTGYWQFPTRFGGVYRDDAMSEESREVAHRVVVINPDDAEQVERLSWAIDAACVEQFEDDPSDAEAIAESVPALQAALRRLASPTPPKPDEPTGLGAVVEDAEGVLWIRCEHEGTPWVHRYGRAFAQQWRHLKVVRVLSEGVQA